MKKLSFTFYEKLLEGVINMVDKKLSLKERMAKAGVTQKQLTGSLKEDGYNLSQSDISRLLDERLIHAVRKKACDLIIQKNL